MDRKLERLRDWGCDVDGALERMLDDEDSISSAFRCLWKTKVSTL